MDVISGVAIPDPEVPQSMDFAETGREIPLVPNDAIPDIPLQYIGFDQQGSHSSSIFQTPNGTRIWSPNVQEEHKPCVGMVFKKWDDVVTMYDLYAEMAGFITRAGAMKKWNGLITHRYLLCNKAGKLKGQKFDTMDASSIEAPRRRSTFKVTNCKACIKLKAVKGSCNFVLYEFVERHNHDLISSDIIDMSRKGRCLPFGDLQFIHSMSLNRVGPTVAHRLHSALKGGHHNMRGTKIDYKNVSRDIRMFISERDAQLVINRLKHRLKHLSNFSFEFSSDQGELKSLFWADEISKVNYDLFGEVLAFDATYSTNKYNMIFVPFTGVDHHKKCVTFGAGLLSNETAESYIWLLKCFLKAHINQPRLVLTDQDPAMKVAVSCVFTKSLHRLCMWHIMKKLSSKISSDLYENSKIRSSIHKLVWNIYIKPSTFEERWQNLMNEFQLNDHVWLLDIYSIRHSWVPAFFRDIPMCCLMKTTSRCESSNSFYKVNSTPGNPLVQFLMCFDTSIDMQRYNQRILEYKTNRSKCDLYTGLLIEKHASDVYTQTIFLEVQKEISKGMMFCYIVSVEAVEGMKVYTIAHSDKTSSIVNEFKVNLLLDDKSVSCSCMGFTRIGYLCRHIFCVFRYNKIEKIPNQYILSRWRREVLPKNVYSIANRYAFDNSEQALLRNEVLDLVTECMDRLMCHGDGLVEFADQIREIKRGIFEKQTKKQNPNKRLAAIRQLLEEPEESDVAYSVPQEIRNKGCGKGRRLVGPGEKAVKMSKKNPRLCRTCMKYVTDHDSRNCSEKNSVNTFASQN